MGGGDLNLKKSWHPSTFRNQERVWKQEQKELEERRKLEQWKKEQAEECKKQEFLELQEQAGLVKRSDRIDWLYTVPAGSGGALSAEKEEYLLGNKRAEKALTEQAKAQATTSKGLSSAIDMISLSNPDANSARDLMAKVREDPLFMIRKREQDSLKQIMANPLHVKQLKEKCEKSDKKKKKKKKKDPRSRSRNRSPSSSFRRSNRSDHDYHDHPRSHLSPSSSRYHRNFKRSQSPTSPPYYRDRSYSLSSRHQSHYESPSPPRNRDWDRDRDRDRYRDTRHVEESKSSLPPSSSNRRGTRELPSRSSQPYAKKWDRDHMKQERPLSRNDINIDHKNGPSTNEKINDREAKLVAMISAAKDVEADRAAKLVQRERETAIEAENHRKAIEAAAGSKKTSSSVSSFQRSLFGATTVGGVESVAEVLARNRNYLNGKSEQW